MDRKAGSQPLPQLYQIELGQNKTSSRTCDISQLVTAVLGCSGRWNECCSVHYIWHGWWCFSRFTQKPLKRLVEIILEVDHDPTQIPLKIPMDELKNSMDV